MASQTLLVAIFIYVQQREGQDKIQPPGQGVALSSTKRMRIILPTYLRTFAFRREKLKEGVKYVSSSRKARNMFLQFGAGDDITYFYLFIMSRQCDNIYSDSECIFCLLENYVRYATLCIYLCL